VRTTCDAQRRVVATKQRQETAATRRSTVKMETVSTPAAGRGRTAADRPNGRDTEAKARRPRLDEPPAGSARGTVVRDDRHLPGGLAKPGPGAAGASPCSRSRGEGRARNTVSSSRLLAISTVF